MVNPIIGVLGVPLARLVQLVTSITLVNNTAKTQDITCPAGKRWVLLSFQVTNRDDVSRDITAYKYKEAAKTNLIKNYILGQTVTTLTSVMYPSKALSDYKEMEHTLDIYDEGNTLSVYWAAGGASTGIVDADGLVLEYLETDV